MFQKESKLTIEEVLMTERVKFDGIAKNNHMWRATQLAFRESTGIFVTGGIFIPVGIFFMIKAITMSNAFGVFIALAFLTIGLFFPLYEIVKKIHPVNYLVTYFSIYFYEKNPKNVLRIKFEKIVSVKLKSLKKHNDEKLGENLELVIVHKSTIDLWDSTDPQCCCEVESTFRVSGIENIMEIYDYINERLEANK